LSLDTLPTGQSCWTSDMIGYGKSTPGAERSERWHSLYKLPHFQKVPSGEYCFDFPPRQDLIKW